MEQQHHPVSPEITFPHQPTGGTSRIWKTFWLLLVITLIELGLGLTIYGFNLGSGFVVFLKGAIVILSLAKAYYIVSIFMHLGDEIRNLIMTIVVPLLLFLWFIIAFLWEGDSWKNFRNEYNKDKEKIEARKPGTMD